MIEQNNLIEKGKDSENRNLEKQIFEIKEGRLANISPLIIIKPALFSFTVLVASFFIDLSSVPILGNISASIAHELYPSWSQSEQAVQPIQFWWLPIISYLLFLSIAVKEYKGLFSHVRSTTPRENIDRIISSSISLIDGYATALPLIGAAFLLVSIKLGPEIFLGLSVPFEIKALIVLAIAKLFEPVLDYIGVKFQKVINVASDYQEQYYQKLQVKQTNELIEILSAQNISKPSDINFSAASLSEYREELERIKTISFETYQNFTAINKLTLQIKNSLDGNMEHLNQLEKLSNNIDSMASGLNNDSVLKSLNSLEHIVNKR